MKMAWMILAAVLATACNSDAKRVAPKQMGDSSPGNPPGGIIPEITPPVMQDPFIPEALNQNWSNEITTLDTTLTEINARKIASEANLKASLDNLVSWERVTSDPDKEVRELLRAVVVKHHCEVKSLELEGHENELRKAELQAWMNGDIPALSVIEGQIAQLLNFKSTCERLHIFMISERPYLSNPAQVYTPTIAALNAKLDILVKREADLATDLALINIDVLKAEIEKLNSNLAALKSISISASSTTLAALTELKNSGSVTGADLTKLEQLITSLQSSSATQTLITSNINSIEAILATKNALLSRSQGSSDAALLIRSAIDAEKLQIQQLKELYLSFF